MIGNVKNGSLSAEAIFALEWKKIAIIRKKNDFDYFETDSLKEIDFLSEKPRTAFSRECISTTIERDSFPPR